ncbi:MAG: hypothetical protein JSU77_02795 [Fidelibacterota bacterium]|nr:MAG: hypothetical protein JSU77_02795 [Candidatus Neomarinimicrobiota bacterium]
MRFVKSIRIVIGLALLMVVVVACQRAIRQATPQDDPATSPARLAMMVASLTPEGWEIYDRVMQFTAGNLYEQIDGRAEYYIAYDVIGLTFASFDKSADNNISLNVSIYDMGTPTNAFGVFSGERSTGVARLELGRDAYSSGANYYIWKGRYYVQIVALDTLEIFKQVGLDMAEKLTSLLQDSGEPVWGLTVLPEANRVPQSVQYFLVDAMGLDFMRNTYMAQYTKGDVVVTAFLSQRDSQETAQATMAEYIEYANRYGEGVNSLTTNGVELVSCDMNESYDVVFQKGKLVGGVSMVEDQSLAIQGAIDLWRQLPQE